MSKPFGYWTINNHLNGLKGSESTLVQLDDGRVIIQKDANNPAILEDVFILNALSRSRQARDDFNRLFPGLDPASQYRLETLLAKYPKYKRLIRDEQDRLDAVQKKNIKAGVHVRRPRPYR